MTGAEEHNAQTSIMQANSWIEVVCACLGAAVAMVLYGLCNFATSTSQNPSKSPLFIFSRLSLMGFAFIKLTVVLYFQVQVKSLSNSMCLSPLFKSAESQIVIIPEGPCSEGSIALLTIYSDHANNHGSTRLMVAMPRPSACPAKVIVFDVDAQKSLAPWPAIDRIREKLSTLRVKNPRAWHEHCENIEDMPNQFLVCS